MLPAAKKDVVPTNPRSMVIYEYVCSCDSPYVGRTNQRIQERIKQHVPKAIRQRTTPTHEQGTHRSNQPEHSQIENTKQKVRLNSNQRAIQPLANINLLESNQCARNYFDSQFKILTTALSQVHLSLLEAVYISRKKQICADKSNSYLCRQKVGTNNIILKAQRNKAQRSFQPVEAQRKMRH